MADAEGVVDAFVDTDMDALKSNNANKGVNMGIRQNKKLKTRKGRIVIQYNIVGFPIGNKATELATYLIVLILNQITIKKKTKHSGENKNKKN